LELEAAWDRDVGGVSDIIMRANMKHGREIIGREGGRGEGISVSVSHTPVPMRLI
jgi:hypothetical protein